MECFLALRIENKFLWNHSLGVLWHRGVSAFVCVFSHKVCMWFVNAYIQLESCDTILLSSFSSFFFVFGKFPDGFIPKWTIDGRNTGHKGTQFVQFCSMPIFDCFVLWNVQKKKIGAYYFDFSLFWLSFFARFPILI